MIGNPHLGRLKLERRQVRLGSQNLTLLEALIFSITPLGVNDGDRFNSCQVIYSQFGLAIHQNDHQARRRFVEWAQNEIAVVPDFHKRILFSDEAHFWLNGYVKKQNCHIWIEANPQVYVEIPLHPEKLTLCCVLWAGGIMGPYFFKNDEGYNVTVNGDRYRAMITNFFIPKLNNRDVQELWFQQDGATCHTARATIDLLKYTFGDCLISRFGPVNWPPRSCDLTPLDYFLWGYVKSLVYADKPQTLDHLEDNIRRVIADIRPQMLENVYEKWTSRLDYIRSSRGSHMPEMIFKIFGNYQYRFPPEEWLLIYTDGSLLDFAQGAGIGVFSHLFSFYLYTGPLTTHFDDSTSALQALSNYNENNCLRVQNCIELTGKIKGKIVFQWLPFHCGLWGNERADFLAKKGTASRVARDKPWSTLCKKSHGIPSSPRAAAVAKFRLLSGHDCLCAHLFRFNLVTSPICVLCDTGQDMTAAHLDECSALNDLNCIVKDDRVSQEIAPHTVTPCEIAVCRSTINAGSDRLPVRLQTRVRWSSSLRLNRDSSLKMTRLQSVTLQVARGCQNPVDTAYDVGQW
ncbi:transposable element Tc3 transposase [Trichonephila clavipes]|uniref:Transposable element Tc3 transposase n=1 Tax=Trichonephila clavipes TaxID=2585209 RepID=A0A8X6UYJ2_TRICX|nr:transposable element Tc3 transposase [Trichonephila clavipes]